MMAKDRPMTNMEKYWANMTPEQAREKRMELARKRQVTMARKRNLIQQAYKKAEEFLPQAIANNLMAAEDSNWMPDQTTINRVAEMIKDGVSPDEIKVKVGASDKSWEKIAKVLFHSIEPNVQDIGLQLYGAKFQAVKAAAKMVKTIEKEIKAHKSNQKLDNKSSKQEHIRKRRATIPPFLLTQLAKATSDKLAAENEYAKILSIIGTHDKKNSAPTITIKTTIPRPGEAPIVEKVVETRRVSLEEAMKEFGSGS
jgi:hypothetical protein